MKKAKLDPILDFLFKTTRRSISFVFYGFILLIPHSLFSQITVTLQTQHIQCGGFATGVITAIPIGGVSPYTYLWNNGSTDNPLLNVPAGTYTVTVTDDNGVTGSATATVIEPPPLEVEISVTNCDLPGAMQGTISGGTAPFDVEWSTGETSLSISNLNPGQYCLTVTDDNSCAFITCESIGTNLIVELNTSPAVCGSGMGGSASVNVGGGVSPYLYEWNNGETTPTISNLPPGFYTVTITADNGCTNTETGEVETVPGNYPISMDITQPSCAGGNNGSITANASGGVSPYGYAWNTGAIGSTLNNIPAGNYTVTATDAIGCTATQSAVLINSSSLIVNTNPFDPICAGASNGSISAIPMNGATPFSYAWSTGDTTQSINNLPEGIYTITVTDALDCTATHTDTLTAPPAFTVSVSTINATQCGFNNGSASATPSGGGSPPFTYLWNTGANGNNLNNIGAGTYTVTVTSIQGCTAMASGVVTQPDNLIIDITGSTLVCGNDDDGELTASVTYGNPPYIFEWSNGDSTQTITDLASGTYMVTITSFEGCTGMDTYTIAGNPEITISEEIDSVSCFDLSNGRIMIELEGGTPPLDIQWSNGSNSTILNNLNAGEYTVSITDDIGCTKEQTYTVYEPDAINILFTNSNGSCGNDGFSSASVSGGTAPYEYEWNNGATTNSIFGIAPGEYKITVSDAKGCSATSMTEIPAFPQVAIEVDAFNTTCNGTTDGIMIVNAIDGTAPFNYLWNNAATNDTINNLNPGLYLVTVTDANNCTATGQDTIFLGDGLNISIDAPTWVCPGEFESATVFAQGGTPGYTYLWSNGQTEQTAVDLGPGQYSVTATDPTGCSGEASVVLEQGGGFSVNFTFEDVDCFDAATGRIDLDVTNGLPPYNYLWDNGDTTSFTEDLTAGDYIYIVSDSTECQFTDTITVNEPPLLEVEIDAFNGICGNLGSAAAIVSGGTVPYQYSWSTLDTVPVIVFLDSAQYNITITDNNDCTVTDSVLIDVISQPSCFIELTSPISDLNGSDGELTAIVDGGTGPFEYLWNDGQTNETAVGLESGTYTVTVTDKDSCQTICNFTLFGPGKIGDFVWLDENENGVQDNGESGMEGVEILLEGTNVYGVDNSLMTISNSQGNYEFITLPGSYQLTFKTPSGFVPSPLDAGADDGADSDANQLTGTTTLYTVGSGETNLTVDAGFYVAPPCDNVTDAGAICCDQTLCGPGQPAQVISETSSPSGGSGDLEYLWMFDTVPGPFDPAVWTPIIDANNPEFLPTSIERTTYFVRCVRRTGCIEFLETSQITISVDSVAVASIDGPSDVCVEDQLTFTAPDNGAGASYSWTFEDGVPEMANTRVVNDVSWNSFGLKTIALSVEKDGCISNDTSIINVSNLPTYCGDALIISGEEISPNVVQLNWYYEESDSVDRFFEVEWAWQSDDFVPIGEQDSVFSTGMFNQYFHTHFEPRRGSNFYRVRLTDSDGTELISNTVEIRLVGEFDLTHVYPNPFKDYLFIEVIDRFDLPVSIDLFNAYGQKVTSANAPDDVPVFMLRTDELATGYYFLWVKYDGKPQKLFKLVRVN